MNKALLVLGLYLIPMQAFTQTTWIKTFEGQENEYGISVCETATGRTVEKLIDNDLVTGSYSLTWNKTALPAGIYFVRLKTKDCSATEKLLIIR